MQIIVNKEIDLSNCTPGDLRFNYPRGTQLILELDGSTVVSVQGHNMLSDTYYILPIIEVASYDILTKAKKKGMYNVDITNVDTVEVLTDSTKGKLYIKIIASRTGQK